MSLEDVIWDAIERRANYTEEIARERRIAESREARDRYEFRDPALHIPGRVDNQREGRKRKR